MTALLFVFAGIVILAALGALARVVGADSRDEIDDTHAGRTLRGTI
jgi:hypothetical protein